MMAARNPSILAEFITVSRGELGRQLAHQLRFVAPKRRYRAFDESVDAAVDRAFRCFSRIVLPGYRDDGKPVFNVDHSDQYAAFLYFVSNEAWKAARDLNLAVDCFRLNKALHGLNCMYDTQLPEVFALIHTVGMVLGKAAYGNYFVAYQNVTVGTDHGAMPHLGDHVVLFGGSMVLGDSKVAGGVVVSANTTIINQEIPPDSVVAGASPNLIVKRRKRSFDIDYFE